MSHYFINDTSVKEEIHSFSYTFLEREYQFISDNGLFSKEHVDYASNILINSVGDLSGSLLDMGCGYGAMGIMLSGAYELSLTLADVNEKAVRFAEENAKNNHIKAECIVSDCFANITKIYDAIIINPPIHAGKKVIYRMYEESYAHLSQGGKLFVVIQKKHGAQSTQVKLGEVFHQCTILYKKKGFFVYECVKQ